MSPDIDILGVFVPSLLVLVVLSYALYRLLHLGLARAGAYRHVWHPALFDVALYFCVLSACALGMEYLLP